MPGPFTTPVALSTPFEPNRNPQWGGNAGPSGIQSINVQDAIEEVKADALANDRFLVIPHYGGNANVGRYFEFFPQQGSDISPIYSASGIRVLSVVLQTTSATATCNVGLFDLNVSSVVPVYTIVMTAQKRVSYVGSPLASLASNCLLAIRVTSGSINTPSMQIFFSSST
jgi:hypothetical protein